MQRLARNAARSPVTRAVALQIVAASPTPASRAVAIRDYLLEHWSFIPDPVDIAGGGGRIELLREPVLQLRRITLAYMAEGDCDDAAMLAAALALAAGLKVRYRVVAFAGPMAPFVHVVTDVQVPGAWVPLDVTRQLQPDDMFPILPTRSFTVSV